MFLNMCCPHYLQENENWNEIVGWIKIQANIHFKKIHNKTRDFATVFFLIEVLRYNIHL